MVFDSRFQGKDSVLLTSVFIQIKLTSNSLYNSRNRELVANLSRTCRELVVKLIWGKIRVSIYLLPT
jgi:hypothetical protein